MSFSALPTDLQRYTAQFLDEQDRNGLKLTSRDNYLFHKVEALNKLWKYLPMYMHPADRVARAVQLRDGAITKEEQIRKTAAAIRSLEDQENLNANSSILRLDPDGFLLNLEAMAQNQASYKSIISHFKEFNEYGFQQIVAALRTQVRLELLNISNLTEAQVFTLAEALQNCKQIKSVMLGCHNFSETALKRLQELVGADLNVSMRSPTVFITRGFKIPSGDRTFDD